MFCRVGVLNIRNIAIFMGKHLCWSLFLKTLMTPIKVLACEYCKFLQSALWLLLVNTFSRFLFKCFNLFQVFYFLSFRSAALLKRLQHRYFPVNIAKCLKTAFLQNTSSRRFWLLDVFVDVSEVKEDTLKRDVNNKEDIKQLHSGNYANSINSVRNLSCEHNVETYDRVRH